MQKLLKFQFYLKINIYIDIIIFIFDYGLDVSILDSVIIFEKMKQELDICTK